MYSNSIQVTVSIAGDTQVLPLEHLQPADVQAGSPVRVLRWHRGQRHYSGWYAAATENRHVLYESRMELVRLMKADMDPEVAWIRAQPLQIQGTLPSDERSRRHVPDFALGHDDGSVRMVNVKTAQAYARPEVREALDWAGQVFAAIGWRHEVWTGESAQYVANLKWLAAFRSPALFRVSGAGAAAILSSVPGPLAQVEQSLTDAGISFSRGLVMHGLWCGFIAVDMEASLGPDSWVFRP